MAKISMPDWANEVMHSGKRHALPIMTHPGIELLNFSVIDAVRNGHIQSLAIQALAEKFAFAGATMIMDLTVEAEAFGSKVNFRENEVPVVNGRIVHDLASVHELEIPSVDNGRIPEYLRAARLVVKGISGRPVFGGCIGPFSLAGRLFDMTEIMTAACIEPHTVSLLLEKCLTLIGNYIGELKKTGVNGVIIAEPAAGLLDESLCDIFSTSYIKRLVADYQEEDFMMILHNCGNTGHLTRSMVNSGAKALHFGNRINLVRTLQEVPSEILVMGNIDPVCIFKMTSPVEMKAYMKHFLQSTGEYRNFIVSSGCDIPPGVPFDNIVAFYEALDEFNNGLP